MDNVVQELAGKIDGCGIFSRWDKEVFWRNWMEAITAVDTSTGNRSPYYPNRVAIVKCMTSILKRKVIGVSLLENSTIHATVAYFVNEYCSRVENTSAECPDLHAYRYKSDKILFNINWD